MNDKKQFVIYPHDENSDIQPNLTPKDKLIYVTIRRYMDKENMEAYPSYAKITEDTGAAAKTIKKSVDNLKREGYLNTRKDGRKIVYIFNNKKKFEPYSYEFLDRKDLSFTEKSYIVATQQYMFKDEDTQEGAISYSNRELSKRINMPESTVSKINRSLENKGLLSGASELTKRFNLRELDQVFIWKFKEQDEKIQKNTDDIEELKRAVRELQLENKKLREKGTKLGDSKLPPIVL